MNTRLRRFGLCTTYCPQFQASQAFDIEQLGMDVPHLKRDRFLGGVKVASDEEEWFSVE
jgi:hypothetical protein